MNIRVRPATTTDAVRAIEIVRASIAQLCVADHRNDKLWCVPCTKQLRE